MKIFHGRFTGQQFFFWCLPQLLTGAVFRVAKFDNPWIAGYLSIFYLVTLAVAIVAGVRRSHDLGHSGWFVLILLVPFAGWYFVFAKSKGDNEYGPAPICTYSTN